MIAKFLSCFSLTAFSNSKTTKINEIAGEKIYFLEGKFQQMLAYAVRESKMLV